MLSRYAPMAVIAIAFFSSSAWSQQAGISEEEFNRWLKEEVTWIIGKSELREARNLDSDAQRRNFVEQFWQIRDPTPDTPENEYRDTHYQRLEHVNKEFREGGAGWRTDRGRVYILHGAPVSRNRQGTQEVWSYNANPFGEYYTGPILLVFAQGASSFQATQLSDTLTARHRNAPSAGLAGVDIPTGLGVSSDYKLIVAGPVNELTASATEVVPGRGPASERLLTGTVESDRYIADILRSPGELLRDREEERLRHQQALNLARNRMLASPEQPGTIRLDLLSRIFRQDQTTGLHFSVSIASDQIHSAEPLESGKKGKKKRNQKDSPSSGVLTDLVCEVVAEGADSARDSMGGTLDAQPGQELVFNGWFELAEGDSQIQCLASESERNRSGWVRQDIEFPALEGDGIALSSLLITSDVVRLVEDHPPLPLVFEHVQFRIPALPRFLPGPLFLYFQVFHGVNEEGVSKELHYDYAVRANNRSILSSLPLIPLQGGEATGSTLAFARTLDFSDLAPGHYDLELRLLEQGSRRPVHRKVNFEILQREP